MVLAMGWPSRSAAERSTEVLFASGSRHDASPMRPNEGIYEFLDRSAKPLFGEVRRVLNEWLADLPEELQHELAPRLRSNDQHIFESAFWELYLHTAYVRSGYHVTAHPDVPASAKRPDFMVERNGTKFYLEAVRVGTGSSQTASARRLQEVLAVLTRQRSDGRFVLSLVHSAVGPNALPTTSLRSQLKEWLDGLDADAVLDDLTHGSTYDRAPKFPWNEEGWVLAFQAIPLRAGATGTDQSLLGISGPGEAEWVDNITGVRRVLKGKAHKYGSLEHPLVIAVMSNTKYPTEDYEFEQALFGRNLARPVQSGRDPRLVVEAGHWLTRQGWRRGDAPQVIAASDLNPWSVTRVHPRLWTTLEPDATLPSPPGWLSRVTVAMDQTSIREGSSLEKLFGLPAGWGI